MTSPPPSGAREHAAALGTVLIVDDEVRIRRVARRVLQRAGYEALEAESGRIGLELFDSHAHQLLAVLLDVDLIDMNGLEMARVMQQKNPLVKLIISTGELSIQVPPGVSFLRKPYRSSELLQLLTEVPEAPLTPAVAC